MTYEEIFSNCRTTGECRRIKVSLLCKEPSDMERYMIEEAYKKRCEEIRPEHGTKLKPDELEERVK